MLGMLGAFLLWYRGNVRSALKGQRVLDGISNCHIAERLIRDDDAGWSGTQSSLEGSACRAITRSAHRRAQCGRSAMTLIDLLTMFEGDWSGSNGR